MMMMTTTIRPTFSPEGMTEVGINTPELGLEISPQVLYFGARNAPIDIDKEVNETIVVKNTSSKKVKVHFYLPSDDERMQLQTSEPTLVIKPGAEDAITVYLTLLCTTKVETAFPVVVESTKTYSKIRICVESALSTKLDYNELEVKELIGEGAFGSVYSGLWRGTEVAIKDFRSAVSPESAKKIAQEIGLLERLRSPYIVTFYGTVSNNKHNCIVMELAPLGSLGKVLQTERLSYELKLAIALDCAKGMTFLHYNHVLHRDLKTDNLLVMSLDVDSPQRVKITDFGASRMVTDEAARSYTHAVGTPVYTSPEILNNQPYSEKADVYSFGILMWSLYMQLVPYENEFNNNFAIIKHVLEGKRYIFFLFSFLSFFPSFFNENQFLFLFYYQ